MRTDSSAAMRKVSISRVTSPAASLIGLPASMHSASASSSRRSANRLAQCCRTAWRAHGLKSRIGAAAFTAAAIAFSVAFASGTATRVASLPLYLSSTSSICFEVTGLPAR